MATCHVCGLVKKTSWCMSCAKDTCRDCRASHLPGCFNEAKNKCHQCGKRIRTVENLDDINGIVIQSFTGRTFCDDGCFADYRFNEGF